MPKYLFQGSYTVEGARGLLRDGGSKRRAAIAEMIAGLGGRLEAFYFAYGETDVFAIAHLPDPAGATAASLTITASGAARVKTTVLVTSEEIDQATGKKVPYTAPGEYGSSTG